MNENLLSSSEFARVISSIDFDNRRIAGTSFNQCFISIDFQYPNNAVVRQEAGIELTSADDAEKLMNNLDAKIRKTETETKSVFVSVSVASHHEYRDDPKGGYFEYLYYIVTIRFHKFA